MVSKVVWHSCGLPLYRLIYVTSMITFLRLKSTLDLVRLSILQTYTESQGWTKELNSGSSLAHITLLDQHRGYWWGTSIKSWLHKTNKEVLHLTWVWFYILSLSLLICIYLILATKATISHGIEGIFLNVWIGQWETFIGPKIFLMLHSITSLLFQSPIMALCCWLLELILHSKC